MEWIYQIFANHNTADNYLRLLTISHKHCNFDILLQNALDQKHSKYNLLKLNSFRNVKHVDDIYYTFPKTNAVKIKNLVTAQLTHFAKLHQKDIEIEVEIIRSVLFE